jgi:hypothetical protein
MTGDGGERKRFVTFGEPAIIQEVTSNEGSDTFRTLLGLLKNSKPHLER